MIYPAIPYRVCLVILALAWMLCTAGCTMPFMTDNTAFGSSDTSAPAAVAEHQRTLAQPEDTAKMVRMDSDVYNIGEVVEFVITNEKSSNLVCLNDPPSFSVRYQKGTGQWVTRMGEENPVQGVRTILEPGESTAPYRFVTESWAPGRYRIISDCGVLHEILLRAHPAVTPAGASCPFKTDSSPFIQVNQVSDQYTGEPFTITGTTSLAAGDELRYSIFAIVSATENLTSARLVSSTLTVSAGTCGTNTWSVEGVIQVPGDYFIGISSSDNSISAVKRFTVLEKARPTAAATLPEKTTAPGISAG
ncbi:MAG TPA: hypothetical protein VLL74_07415 [Methanoregula sp.]|nr:hypothetical protein [Methanoregula sp.]